MPYLCVYSLLFIFGYQFPPPKYPVCDKLFIFSYHYSSSNNYLFVFAVVHIISIYLIPFLMTILLGVVYINFS